MQSLLDLIKEAQSQLETYKYPDTSEVETRLDELLRAGNLGAISGDELTGLHFYEGFLHIATRYSVRSCEQTGHYKIPVEVFSADDPLMAVKIWAKEQRVAKARSDVASAEHALARRREELAKAEAEDASA